MLILQHHNGLFYFEETVDAEYEVIDTKLGAPTMDEGAEAEDEL